MTFLYKLLTPAVAIALVVFMTASNVHAGDPVVRKYAGQISYAEQRYEKEVKKIKFAMLRDYKLALRKAMAAKNLEEANTISKKIKFLEGDLDDAGVVSLDFTKPVTVLESVKGTVKPGNLALATNGTKAKCRTHPEQLNDGNVTEYDGSNGFGYDNFPCSLELEFTQAYILSFIQFLLWDGADRFYRYKVEVSKDGEKWDEIVDHSEGEWRSWQLIEFKPRPVKYIRIQGLHNSANGGFHVVEIEAFSRKPKKPRVPKKH